MTKRAHGEGSLLKRKGCRLWYAQYYDATGKQVRVSTKTDVKQEALGVLRKLMGDRDRGLAPITDARKIMYSDLRRALLDNYVVKGNRTLQIRADTTETIVGLKQLDDFFGYKEATDKDGKRFVENPGVSVAQITTDVASDFTRKRRAQGAGPAMINRSLQCLRRMLNLAQESKKIQFVPKIYLLKEPPARKGFLEGKKFEELVNLLPTHLQPLILFLYWCGVRKGEALSIEWPQVDLDGRVIRLEEEQTKSGEARIVPLPAVLVNLLTEATPKVGKVFSDTNLRTEWEKACAACGLGTREKVETKDYTWHRYRGLIVHDLRRSAVRNLRRAGVPETVAMKISGHKTRHVFERYNIVSTDDVTNAMRLVESSSLATGKKDSAKLVQNRPRNRRKLLTGA
jgi:integrase